jgi:hypothetical protein
MNNKIKTLANGDFKVVPLDDPGFVEVERNPAYLKQIEESAENKQAGVDKLCQLLEQHNLQLNIDGCGCCGSPAVAAWYKGEKLFDGSNIRITMRENDEQANI